jgi:nucleoside diphosphate kinase
LLNVFPFSAKIISRFEEKGFKLVAMKLKQASKELLETHYEDLKEKKFFPGLIQYMSSGPVCPMVSFSASSCQAFDLLATATARTAKKLSKRGHFASLCFQWGGASFASLHGYWREMRHSPWDRSRVTRKHGNCCVLTAAGHTVIYITRATTVEETC